MNNEYDNQHIAPIQEIRVVKNEEGIYDCDCNVTVEEWKEVSFISSRKQN